MDAQFTSKIPKNTYTSVGLGSHQPQMMAAPKLSSEAILKNQSALVHEKKPKLPLIVDICLDDQTGCHYYLMHEAKSMIRKEMPTSQSAQNMVVPAPQELPVAENEFHQASANNWNKPKSKRFIEIDGTQSQMERAPFRYEHEKLIPSNNVTFGKENRIHTSRKDLNAQDTTKGADDAVELQGNDHQATDEIIWSEDVEGAFIEALSIIPKKGLTKIKISGRTCGRNELISDFILTKTGKFRSRKQVSSHIQVIKNMKRNKILMDLIKYGPSSPRAPEKFKKVFGKINFQKSIGACNSNSGISKQETCKTFDSSDKPEIQILTWSEFPTHCSAQKRLRRLRTPKKDLNSERGFKVFKDQGKSKHFIVTPKRGYPHCDQIHLDLRNIDFSLSSSSGAKTPFHYFTTSRRQGEIQEIMRLTSNNNLKERFPFANNLVTQNNNSAPLFYCMCNLALPDYGKFNLSTSRMTTKTEMVLSNLRGAGVRETRLSCFTVVHSFGKRLVQSFEHLALIEEDSDSVEVALSLAPEFWMAFNLTLKNTQEIVSPELVEKKADLAESDESLGDETMLIEESQEGRRNAKQLAALRGICIEQIIVGEPSSSNRYHAGITLKEIKQQDVKAVVAYEFNRAESTRDSSTSFRQLVLPSDGNICSKGIQERIKQEHNSAEFEQLPTPKTASILRSDKDHLHAPVSSPYIATDPKGSAATFSKRFVPVPPVSDGHYSSRSLTQSSMPSLFHEMLDANVQLSSRSLSMQAVINQPWSPQDSSLENEDIREMNEISSSMPVSDDLMIQVLGSNDLCHSASDECQQGYQQQQASVVQPPFQSPQIPYQHLFHQYHQQVLAQRHAQISTSSALADSIIHPRENDDLGGISKQTTFFW